jgi:hypothetical protein
MNCPSSKHIANQYKPFHPLCRKLTTTEVFIDIHSFGVCTETFQAIRLALCDYLM